MGVINRALLLISKSGTKFPTYGMFLYVARKEAAPPLGDRVHVLLEKKEKSRNKSYVRKKTKINQIS